MFTKRNGYLFLSALVSSVPLYCAGISTMALKAVYTTLFTLGFPFMLVPTLLISLIEQGPAVACQYLVLLACVVGIEAYTLHRMIKVPCTLAVPRMIIINLVDALAQCIVGFLLLVVFQVVYVVAFNTLFGFFNIKQMTADMIHGQVVIPLALLGAVVGIVLFVVRVLTAYGVYQLFDNKIEWLVLRKAILLANFISYGFQLLILLVTVPAVTQLFARS